MVITGLSAAAAIPTAADIARPALQHNSRRIIRIRRTPCSMPTGTLPGGRGISAVPPSIIGAPGRRTALRTTPIAPDNDMPRTALRHAADVLRDSAIEALYALDWTGRFPLGRAPG